MGIMCAAGACIIIDSTNISNFYLACCVIMPEDNFTIFLHNIAGIISYILTYKSLKSDVYFPRYVRRCENPHLIKCRSPDARRRQLRVRRY